MLKKCFALGVLLTGLCAGAVWADTVLTRDDALKALSHPGRWIDTDGAPQPDGTYLAKQIQIAATATIGPKEEPSIYGPVENLERAKGTMKVLGYRIVYDGQTKIQDENKKVILSSKIQEGSAVKVQGNLQPNGVFQASKIKLQKIEKGKTKPKTKIYGPASAVDPRAGTLKVLNTTIKLRPDAQITEQAAQTPNPNSR